MSISQDENLWCRMIVVAGAIPILVASEEMEAHCGDTEAFLDEASEAIRIAYKGLPVPVQNHVAEEFLEMGSVGDPGHGTIVFRNSAGGTEYDFTTRTITVNMRYGSKSLLQQVYEGFAAMMLHSVFISIGKDTIANVWQQPDVIKNRSRFHQEKEEMLTELQGMLPGVPATAIV
jgi:hypothetical protein